MSHCGVCGKKFSTGKECAERIKDCKTAAITLEAVEVIAKTDGLSTVDTSIPAAKLVDIKARVSAVETAWNNLRENCPDYHGFRKDMEERQCTHKGSPDDWCAMDSCPLLEECR